MASNDVLIKLVADVSGLKKELDSVKDQLSNVEKSTSGAGDVLGSTFKKVGLAIAGAFAIDKIKDFAMNMVEVTAKVNALDSMFQQTFKDNQGGALAKISEQAKIQGIEVDRLKGTWSSFYGTFRGNGADANTSLELTSRYMQLAGDGSAYYDLKLEDVVSRLKSITMGNFEAGDAIGLNINATKMNALSVEQLGKKWQDLTDTEKEFLLVGTAEKIYENSGAMGQGARESDNWANVTENLKTKWERLQAILGQPALKIATSVVQSMIKSIDSATIFVQSFSDAFQSCYKATGDFSTALASTFDMMGMPWAGDIVMGISAINDAIESSISWFNEHETVTLILASSIGVLTAGIIAFNVWLNSTAISMAIVSTATGIWNVVAGIGTAITSAFGIAMLFLTSPIGLITMAIMGLVAVGILLYKNWDTIVAWTQKAWGFIATYISTTFTTIVSAVSSAFASIIQWFVDGWNYVSTACSTGWEIIKSVIIVGIMAVLSIIEALFTLITVPIMFVWENIKDYIFSAWEWISSTVTNGINAVINAIVSFLTPIINIMVNIWDSIKEATTSTWEGIKNILSIVITYIVGFIDNQFKILSKGIEIIFNTIKAVITVIWEGIKSFFVQIFGFISNLFNSVFMAIANTVTSIWNNVSSTTLTVWNNIKNNISNLVNGIKSTISGVFDGISSIASSVWNNIKNAMIQPIETAKSKIADLVNGVKNLFNFTLTFPKPKLPHFNLSGSFSLMPPSVPKLNVDWYETGGIFTGASVVGVGENGDEAVLPLSNKKRMMPFASAIADLMPDKDSSVGNDAGLSVVVEKLIVREEADIKKVAEELFRLQERNRRKRGVV